MVVTPDVATDSFRAFVSTAEIAGLIISGLVVTAILALIAFMRKIFLLPKEMAVVKAAMFRLLRSNKKQGIALITIAECQKTQKCNGSTDQAISAVKDDQDKIDRFLTSASLGIVEVEKDE
jgi:hypothetical protein